MRRTGRALARERRGVAALEFAMVSVPLLLLLFGFVATNALFYAWSSMLNSAQNAAMLMATGQITSFKGTATACSTTMTSTQAEYWACQGLPSWASFTVTASENCSTPGTVTVLLTVPAGAAALVDTYGFYTGKTISAQSTMMKQGTCP